ncbi:hypothetical protein PAPHI01_2420 [Pancytospora philotis]|nr:hypothetical protein PAPHI01_2259 [Pancytospora philotis]KAI4293146.1 hypothetical protein PAPHI01_2420 [Pancytospora philotis]
MQGAIATSLFVHGLHFVLGTAPVESTDARSMVNWYNPPMPLYDYEHRYFHAALNGIISELASSKECSADQEFFVMMQERLPGALTRINNADKVVAWLLDLFSYSPKGSVPEMLKHCNAEMMLCTRKFLVYFLQCCGSKTRGQIQYKYAGKHSTVRLCKDYVKAAREFIEMIEIQMAALRGGPADYKQLVSSKRMQGADYLVYLIVRAGWDKRKVESEFQALFRELCDACGDLDYFLQHVQPFMHKVLDAGLLYDSEHTRVARMLVQLIATRGMSKAVDIFDRPEFNKKVYVYPLLSPGELKKFNWRTDEILIRFLIRLDVIEPGALEAVCMWLLQSYVDHTSQNISWRANMSFKVYCKDFWAGDSPRLSVPMNLLLAKAFVSFAKYSAKTMHVIRDTFSAFEDKRLAEMLRLLPYSNTSLAVVLANLTSERLHTLRTYLSNSVPERKDDEALLRHVNMFIVNAIAYQAKNICSKRKHQ